MTKQVLIAAATFAALLSTGVARADDASRPLTRDEVVAQTLAARQSGELAVLETGGVWTANQQPSALSRDQVVADTLAARQSGELAAIETGAAWNGNTPAAEPASRDKVVNDMMTARHAPSDQLAIEHSI
ncbi:MAG: DUF4148 domain-containing protein [Proteobacteria bacterium]|nr:DUF4148 domain-containing protein [Pseudomonadota bacterium]